MNRLIALVVAALAVLLAAGPGLAQTVKPATQHAATHTPRLKNTSGEVVSLDQMAKTLTVKPTAGKTAKELTFTVADSAAGSLAQLKPGDRIRVGYTREAGTLTAEKIVKIQTKAKL